MKKSNISGLWALILSIPLVLASAGASAVVTTQLGFVFDGSGSIDATEFSTQTQGLSSALSALPLDGSVELTVVQFASSARVELGPVVITAANIVGVQNAVAAISQIGGGTLIPAGLGLATTTMIGSTDYSPSLNSIINVSTDGFSGGDLIAAANASKTAGIDAVTAEAIGTGANTTQLLTMVYNPISTPNDGSAVLLAVPTNPLTNPAWVVPVADFTAFGPVVVSKIQAVVPEPAALVLMGIALVAVSLGSSVRRRGMS